MLWYLEVLCCSFFPYTTLFPILKHCFMQFCEITVNWKITGRNLNLMDADHNMLLWCGSKGLLSGETRQFNCYYMAYCIVVLPSDLNGSGIPCLMYLIRSGIPMKGGSMSWIIIRTMYAMRAVNICTMMPLIFFDMRWSSFRYDFIVLKNISMDHLCRYMLCI